jgi:hypothetical protein
MSGVTYENLLVAGGRFACDGGDIETVVVPANSTIARGTVLGRATATGKYATGNAVSYTTTGSEQIVTTAVGEVVSFAVASGSTGTGTVGNYYQALTVQADVDLDTETFATDTTNWLDLGAVTGSETTVAVASEDAVNATSSVADVKVVVWKKGTFNSLGVTFGNGKTVANTKNDLHNVSIEITQGEA